jgi:hypothetical protein
MHLRSFAVSVCLLAVPLAAQEMPKPGKEHQKLAASVGTWDAVIEMVGEDGKPATSKGVSAPSSSATASTATTRCRASTSARGATR